MCRYYAVIGNRDHIKYQGRKAPIWEFMDQLPDGWLTSLAYATEDLPDGEYSCDMIFDCGAWSYKDSNDSSPMLGKDHVTSAWAMNRYRSIARPGDLVIAPDHMLIPGLGDMNVRRRFNQSSARRFLCECQGSGFRPMAVVHGENAGERVETARRYVDLGYTALALGGLAGQASRTSVVIEAVTEVRRALPGVWLHVLGLSSPNYASAWHHLGVESFDGSSHFKQAFSAGTFFAVDGPTLLKYKAGRDHVPAGIPDCDCRACTMLRGEDIDTRKYGSNENNMGRAVHNLNMLMRAHRHLFESRTRKPIVIQKGLL